MLALLLITSFSILTTTPEEYVDLANRAKQMIRAYVNAPLMAKPGFYDLNGLSFNLRANLLNNQSRELFGSAVEKEILALVPNRNLLTRSNLESEEKVVYIDTETQRVLQIGSAISDDGTVIILNCTQIDPFTIFTEINMKTSENNSENTAFDCQKGSLGAYCKAEFGHNWETPNENQDGFDLRAVELPTSIPGFYVYHGLYARSFASVNVDIHTLSNIEIDTNFNTGVAAGLGFRFSQKVGPVSLNDVGLEYPIYGYSKSFFGFNFGFAVNLYGTVSLKNVSLYFPKEVNYYRQAQASLSVSGHYRMKNGVWFDQPNFTFNSFEETNLREINSEEFIEKTRVIATPVFDVGLKIKVNAGVSGIELRGGGRFGMDWNFTGNRELCTSPYLYGNNDAFIQAVYANTELKFLSTTIIPSYEKDWNLWRSELSSDHCFFNANRQNESNKLMVRRGSDDYSDYRLGPISRSRVDGSDDGNDADVDDQKKKSWLGLSVPVIISAAMGFVALCLLIALIAVSVENRKLRKENNANGLLDQENSKTLVSMQSFN